MKEFDVVIVGSGAGGLTTATVAARLGLSVLVVESTAWFGGTTALSAGFAWIPCNHVMRAAGCDDSRAEAETYLRGVLDEYYDAPKIKAFLDHGPEMMTWLEQHTDVRFEASDIPDYEADDVEGWKINRTIGTTIYDGKKLGELLQQVRPPTPEMGLFQSMQISLPDVTVLQMAGKSLQATAFVCKLMGRYVLDRLRFGRSTRMLFGNGLVGHLLGAARDAGVTLWNNASATQLVVTPGENGRVTGAVITRGTQKVTVNARRGVVLACGGFGADSPMRVSCVKDAAISWSLQPEGNRGEGIRMGQAIGGTFVTSNAWNVIWTPVSVYRRDDGSIGKMPLAFDRQKPGAIMIDAATVKRFANESHHYMRMGDAVHERGIKKMWLIADAAFLRKYGLGMVKPWPFSTAPWIAKGYLIPAQSIAELAQRIDVDAAALEATVQRFNQFAQQGKDPDFKRGDDYYSRSWGDPTHKPNPTLGPIATPPFYAIETPPGEFATVAGLATSVDAQVLGRDGAPVAGLYAVGADGNSIFGGRYPGGGASIGPAMTFGYIAARHMAGLGT